MNPEGLYFICPACGGDVPRNAKSCPDCGACEKSGWSDDSIYDGLDLPDDEDTALPRLGGDEFGRAPRTSARQWFIWATALLVLIAFVWLTLRGHW